jgi:hypothetical protein
MDFIEYCNQNKIPLAVYPPHSTQTLQPLNVVMFKPLATGYSDKVAAFTKRSQGLTSMSKRDFFPLFYRAWQTSFKETIIPKVFEATGLSPFNPEVILRRFNTSPSSSGSKSLALSTSDCRKMERILCQVVVNQSSKQIKQLSQVLHSNAVQNALLKNEVKGLREALINKRTHRKQGKTLLLEEPEEYYGGAVFRLPRKVKDAREQQQLKDREDQQLQHQKLRQRSIARSQGRRRLRLGYQGRRRRLRRLQNRPRTRQLAGLIHSSKLSKPPKRVRSTASRLLQKLPQKRDVS